MGAIDGDEWPYLFYLTLVQPSTPSTTKCTFLWSILEVACHQRCYITCRIYNYNYKKFWSSAFCLFWTLWPSSRLDYVFLGWALQLRGIGNKPVPMGPRSIWSSSRFCPGYLPIGLSTLHFWHSYCLISLWGIKPAVCWWNPGIFEFPLHLGNRGRYKYELYLCCGHKIKVCAECSGFSVGFRYKQLKYNMSTWKPRTKIVLHNTGSFTQLHQSKEHISS